MTQYNNLGTTPNGSGAEVRVGFNNNFKAIVTDNEGSSAPSPTYPFMVWRNDTTKILYMRNAGDTGWEVVKNYGATTDPTISTDSSLGYVFGSEYRNVTKKKIFRCFDATTGAADWREISVPPYFVSVKDQAFGAKGDGSTDDTTAIQAALDAVASTGGHVYFPQGVYKVSAKLTIANKAISISGAGQIVTELRWTAAAATSGIEITSNNARHCVTIKDISITTLATGGNAIKLDFSGQIASGIVTDRLQKRFVLKDLTIQGASTNVSNNPFADGWQYGILLVAAVNGSIRDCTIHGKAQTPQRGYSGTYGIAIRGNPTTGNTDNGYPANILIDNVNEFFWEYGVAAHNAQEVTVTGGNILACDIGVYLYSQYSRTTAKVIDIHLNCYSFSIYIDGMNEVIVSNCELYGIQTSTAWNALFASTASTSIVVTDNIVCSFDAGANGFVINADKCVVSNNIFDQQGTYIITCIWLTSNAADCKGINNVYNGTFTNTVLNQGTGNAVT